MVPIGMLGFVVLAVPLCRRFCRLLLACVTGEVGCLKSLDIMMIAVILYKYYIFVFTTEEETAVLNLNRCIAPSLQKFSFCLPFPVSITHTHTHRVSNLCTHLLTEYSFGKVVEQSETEIQMLQIPVSEARASAKVWTVI